MSPFDKDPPQVLRVKAGHAAVFKLPPIASVPEPSVTWQREDNQLLYGTKYAVTDDQSQIILSVDSQDKARYRYLLYSVPSINIPFWKDTFRSFFTLGKIVKIRNVFAKDRLV